MGRRLGIIVQARLGSTRLSNKVDLEFYNEASILDILIGKLLDLDRDYPIVLSTGDAPENRKLKRYSEKYPIHFFVGDEVNVLNRFIDTAESFKFSHLLRICSDNPFLDINFLESLIEAFENTDSDYISYQSHEGLPVIRTHFGLFAEIVSLKSLKRQKELETDISIMEHVTMFIYQNPDKFKVNLLDLPNYLHRNDLRFTVDDNDDFINLKSLYESCKEVSTNELVDFIDHNPKIKEKMMFNIKKYSK